MTDPTIRQIEVIAAVIADAPASAFSSFSLGTHNAAKVRGALRAAGFRIVPAEPDVRITSPNEDPDGEGREYVFVQTPVAGEMFDIAYFPAEFVAALRAMLAEAGEGE